LDNIDRTNTELAEMLGRSAWAVECRRRALEVELKLSNPSMTLDECIAQFKADPHSGKRQTDSSSSSVRKRVRLLRPDMVSSGASAATSVVGSIQTVSSDIHIITDVAENIRLNQGSMAEAWTNPDFVPPLIKYYDGFNAFSATLAQKHHPLHPPPAQRAPPVDLPQARGAGQAEPAVAAREERGVGVEVDARVA
jgi:hypothetical protein